MCEIGWQYFTINFYFILVVWEWENKKKKNRMNKLYNFDKSKYLFQAV